MKMNAQKDNLGIYLKFTSSLLAPCISLHSYTVIISVDLVPFIYPVKLLFL